MALKTRVFNSFRKIFTHQPFEKMLLSAVRGSRYLGFRSKVIPGPQLYDFNSIRKVSRNGIDYELDISCLMQWYVYWDLKAKDRDRLYSLIKKGDVVFDVGTNIGETLLNFAKLTGETGYVYGFEPDEKNYTGVQKNISLNSFKNVHVFNVGLSDKKEKVKFYSVEPHNRGMNRILENDADEKSEFTVIETTTLDSIIEDNNIQKLDVIKIDIEGYEMHALRGAVQTLKRFKPALFIEIGYTRLLKNKTSPNDLVRLLEDIGYDITHSETGEKITSSYDFAYLGEGGIDIVAEAK